jgi:hypothetical protein
MGNTERTSDRDRNQDRERKPEAEPSALATVRAYYETLREGEPLAPYFIEDPKAVKFGITERLTGYEAIAEGLGSQTETTTDWTIESHALVVGERTDHAWFADEVSMAWSDTTTGERHDYETRWSGTLERRVGDSDHGPDPEPRSDAESHEEVGSVDDTANRGDTDSETETRVGWQFVSMHVSRSEP